MKGREEQLLLLFYALTFLLGLTPGAFSVAYAVTTPSVRVVIKNPLANLVLYNVRIQKFCSHSQRKPTLAILSITFPTIPSFLQFTMNAHFITSSSTAVSSQSVS